MAPTEVDLKERPDRFRKFNREGDHRAIVAILSSYQVREARRLKKLGFKRVASFRGNSLNMLSLFVRGRKRT